MHAPTAAPERIAARGNGHAVAVTVPAYRDAPEPPPWLSEDGDDLSLPFPIAPQPARRAQPQPPQTAKRAVATSWTAAELLAAEFPEPHWAVPDLVPVGLTFLAGRPKIGKSWLALQIAVAVGSGGVVLGRHVQPGKVLYVALEDNGRRLQDRARKQRMPPTTALTFATSWRRFTEGGLDDLAQAIAREGYTFVVIDTLGRAMGRADQLDLGEMTDLIGRLQESALNHDIAILALDHHRKSAGFIGDPIDDIVGSTAKSAVADAALGIFKEQGKKGATLKVIGRDLEWQDLVLGWDATTCCWQLEGTTEEVELRGQRGKILRILRDHAPDAMTTSEIAEATGIAAPNVSPILSDLVTSGYVVAAPKQGKRQPYALTERGRDAP